ncbi:chorion protein S16 [Lucilia sericata]|uniref:chorion protein S16 n=1 Tax=Lucilia sericata TaxID=13632 RepID=UPI0018A81960|nr:chorion protein S16 [Lucilia sericata]
MYSNKLVLACLGLICLSSCVWAGSYGVAPAPAYQAVYAPSDYAAPDAAEAAASAITDIAAAKASAAKINNVNWAALNKYGYEIGKPLLVRNYGPLTSLYAALAPKRSFVGTVDAGFYKDSYGNIKFSDEFAVGAIAI